MTAGRDGAEDVDRTLALLWRVRGEPAEQGKGRRPMLSVERIVAAAIAVADADGLAAASMHRVAKELGAGTMTLYTYVAGKAELVDLMVDDVLVERRLPAAGEPRPPEWREQVALYADRTRTAYRGHPWLCEVSRVRPPLGPGRLAGHEYLLSIMDGLGLPSWQAVPAATGIGTYVDANAALDAENTRLERTTSRPAESWWSLPQSFWEDIFTPEAHPSVARVHHAGGFAPTARAEHDKAYEFGLNRLLDGIQSLVRTP